MIDDNDFAASLIDKRLGKKYLSEIIDVRKKLKTELKQQDERIHGELKKEIERMELHDQLISRAIFPFLQNGPLTIELGYQFVRCAPLLEKEVKNLDFLIYRKEGKKAIAIFGEAKSSISHPDQIMHEFNDRKKIVDNNKKYILENYLDKSKETMFEYVLCVFSSDVAKMRDAIDKNGGGIILWSADQGFNDLSFVGSNNPNTRASMSHADANLSRMLQKISTHKKASLNYLQSHIVIRLRSIIAVKEFLNAVNDNNSQKFNRSDLEFYLKRVLYYVSSETQISELDYLLKVGLEIRFLKFEDGVYSIDTESKGYKSQQNELQSKWLESVIARRRTEKLENEINKIQNTYAAEDKRQRSMESFLPDKTK